MEQKIADERARITALDATLDNQRTPYLKGRLQFAGHMLDDAADALRLAAQAQPNYVGMWMGFAEWNIQAAKQLREKVQAAVDEYGGPQHVIKVGG